MKRLFLLDVDDTLLDFRRGEREQIVRTLAAFHIPADDGVTARFHAINDALWKALERGEITRERLVAERFEVLFRELGVSAPPRAAAELFFNGMAGCAYLLTGAKAFLQALSAEGRLYAVTNGSSAVQRRRLRNSDLAPLFDDYFISEEIGYHKPSYEYAAYVAAHIPGFSAEEAVWVGDSLTSDMVCAARMRVAFILFRGERPAGYAGLFADTYEDVLTLIKSL